MFILPEGLQKFKRFAVSVWGVSPGGKSDLDTAREGIRQMEEWMREMGLPTRSGALGVTGDNLDAVARSVVIGGGGYHRFTRDDVRRVLEASL